MCFHIDWASLIAGRKFTIFGLFYFAFEGNFPSTSSRGGLIFGGGILRRIFCVTALGGLYLERLIQAGAFFGILRYSTFVRYLSLSVSVFMVH